MMYTQDRMSSTILTILEYILNQVLILNNCSSTVHVNIEAAMTMQYSHFHSVYIQI